MADGADTKAHADARKAACQAGEQNVKDFSAKIHMQYPGHIDNSHGNTEKLKKCGGAQGTGDGNAFGNRGQTLSGSQLGQIRLVTDCYLQTAHGGKQTAHGNKTEKVSRLWIHVPIGIGGFGNVRGILV